MVHFHKLLWESTKEALAVKCVHYVSLDSVEYQNENFEITHYFFNNSRLRVLIFGDKTNIYHQLGPA